MNLGALRKQSILLPWVEARLGAKGPIGSGCTFSSERALACGGKKAEVEKLWQELFSDPSEWQDQRCDKVNPSFPDFKHKKHAHKALWLDSKWIPPWVEANLAALPPDIIQLSIFSWNQRLLRYAQAGQHEKTIEAFQQMQRDGNLDRFTFVHVLKACANLAALEVGRRAHEEIVGRGYDSNVIVGTSLVHMYAKCGSIEEAERVFNQMPTRDVVTLNAMIGGYVKCGEGRKALELFEQMQGQGLDPNPATFVRVLNACASVAALEAGRRAHAEIIRRGYESDVVVGNCLIDMYSRCGSTEEAEKVFNQMTTRNVFTLTAMICAYVKSGEGHKALELFEQMQGHGVDPDRVTFVGILNACSSVAALEVGRRAHEEIIRRGYESDVVVGTGLVDMYAKCGSIDEAERLFKQMPTRNVVTWTAMISAYVKCGDGQKALELFEQMKGQGVDPNRVTFVRVLNACAGVSALEVGRCAHEEITRRGYELDVVLGNCLVDMYAKCGSTEEAEIVFNQMRTRNVHTLTAMIGGYVKGGEGQKALELFEQMQRHGVDPDRVTFVGVLNACASLAALEVGKRTHEEIIRRGCESDVLVGTCLVDMYAKCGRIEQAERLFKQMPTRNVVTWTAMISGYVTCGEGQKALKLFEHMQEQGVDPNRVTFVRVLNACASIAALDKGRRAHEEIIRRGYELDVVLGNCIVDMYAKCGSIEEAERVFDQMPSRNVFTLNAMIGGYVKSGEGQKALELFEQMQGQGMDPDRVTFVGVLNACASVAALEEGRRAHEEIVRRGYELDVVVGTCLVDMYAKCGSIEHAERLFRQMPIKNVVMWTAMISGYVTCGEGQKALEVFEQMQGQGVDPNPVTFVRVLNACASVAALEVGRHVHEEIIRRGYDSDFVVGNGLIDMYAKCGSIEEAERVFNQMPTRDVVAWNALIAAYGIHGFTRKALETFKEMSQAVEVDGVTFLSLLSACSHGGLVAEGLEYFKSMRAVYNITPTVGHFTCVVDLLGRAGRLVEAKDLITSMPMDPNATVWMALLSACRAHVNVEVGEHCVKQVLGLAPDNASAYVLLSNIYVASGKFDSNARLNGERLYRGVKKIPGRTWIKVNTQVHSFSVNDKAHPQIMEIHAELEILSRKMKASGYVPDTRLVLDTSLHCVNEEENEFYLCHHSEKLAIIYGLISTSPGIPLRIVKNLQVCSNCHTATKFIAKMVGRVITARDSSGFHHFHDGLCSCRDYW